MELTDLLKGNGIDYSASSYEDEEAFHADVKAFIHSYEFLQLGQSINRKQWQAAGMKAQKMSAKAKKLGMTGWENLFTGIRQNVARKNQEEALQVMASITTKRVKLMKFL